MSKVKSTWVVHVIGPDDVHPQPDELTALREANEMNKATLQYRLNRPELHDILCVAVAKDSAVEDV